MQQMTIGFIGLGLIGGSLAKRIREEFPDFFLLACNLNPDSTAKAKAEGVIDTICQTPEEMAACDVIFLCAPVAQNIEILQNLAPLFTKDTIVTDVGSTKSSICREAEKLGLSSIFIGGHPMTGSEKSGYQNAVDYLFENAYYILTPNGDTPSSHLALLKKILAATGAILIEMDPAEHDVIAADISHIPHLVAASLVNMVQQQDSDKEWRKRLAAGGFKDLTRIASSSPAMWQEICLENKKPILDSLTSLKEELNQISDLIRNEDADAIYDFFDTAREYRNTLPSSAKGSVLPEYTLFCDIRDESGAIAEVADLLSANGVNLENLSISHNREFEEGILRIDFYEESALSLSETILENAGYQIMRREKAKTDENKTGEKP